MKQILIFAMSVILSAGAIACTYDQECGGQEICCRLSYCSDPLYCQKIVPVTPNESCAPAEASGANR